MNPQASCTSLFLNLDFMVQRQDMSVIRVIYIWRWNHWDTLIDSRVKDRALSFLLTKRTCFPMSSHLFTSQRVLVDTWVICLHFPLVFRGGLPGTAFPESFLLDLASWLGEVVRKHSSGRGESNVCCLSPTLFLCRRARDGKREKWKRWDNWGCSPKGVALIGDFHPSWLGIFISSQFVSTAWLHIQSLGYHLVNKMCVGQGSYLSVNLFIITCLLGAYI